MVSMGLIMAMLCVATGEGGISVTSGIAPYQVYQCGQGDEATVTCSGTVTGGGSIEGRVLAAGTEQTPVSTWTAQASEQEGQWSASFTLPLGGPYALELRAASEPDSTLTIEPLFAGDLWILAGQSNMEGAGNMIDVIPPNDRVMVFSSDDTWGRAEDPLHRRWRSSFPAYNTNEPVTGPDPVVHKAVGPGMAFATEVTRATNRPIGLLPCALGGSSMDQWSPDLKGEGGGSLYGAMLARVAAAGGKVGGVLWYQGESDAANPDAAAAFPEKCRKLVASIRADVNAPDLPFYYVQIGRYVVQQDLEPSWDAVQHTQLALEKEIPHTAMAVSVDAPLDDLIHLSTQGQRIVGQRLARLALRDEYGQKGLTPGPRPESAVWVFSHYGLQVHVTFSDVNGRLVSNGPVSGFSLCDMEGNPLPVIFKQELSREKPNVVIIWAEQSPAYPITEPGTVQLWYGRGRNPHCTVTDEADMGLPVFGRMEIQK